MLYRDGSDAARDAAKAVGWFRKEADLGEPVAMVALAQAPITGKGVTPNRVEARQWLNAALVKGKPYIRDTLGIDRLLVTCNADNPASAAVIVKNGGTLIDVIDHPYKAEACLNRYFITL